MNEYYKQLDHSKFEIYSWNKNLITMELFLSFITVPIEKNKGNYLGSCTGWTQYLGADDLIITGGKMNNVEYLHTIQYKKNLDNGYNNYINPFFMFDILNDEGKEYFTNYYREDIEKILRTKQAEIAKANQLIKNNETDCEFLSKLLK
jgi:hypothetical protein